MLSKEQQNAMNAYLEDATSVQPDVVESSKLSTEEVAQAIQALNTTTEHSLCGIEQLKNIEYKIFQSATYDKRRKLAYQGHLILKLTAVLFIIMVVAALIGLYVKPDAIVLYTAILTISNLAFIRAYKLILEGAYTNDFNQ